MVRTRRMRGGSLPALVGPPYSQSDLSTWGTTNYYPVNTNPIIFTNTSFQMGGKRRKHRKTRGSKRSGKRRGGRSRSRRRRTVRRRPRRRTRRRMRQRVGGLLDSRFTTPFPQPIADAYRNVAHGVSDVYNGLMGNQLSVNPDPGVQPIGTPQGPGAYDLSPPDVQSAVESSNNSVAAL